MVTVVATEAVELPDTVKSPAIVTLPLESKVNLVAPPTVPPVSILNLSLSESSTPIVNLSVSPIWKLKCGSPDDLSILTSPLSTVNIVPSNCKFASPFTAVPVPVRT